MLPLNDIVLQALAGIYGTGITGIDLFRYTPADAAALVSERFPAEGALSVLRDLGVALAILFGTIFFIILAKFRALNRPAAGPQASADLAAMPVPDGPMRGQWGRVLANLESPREADWKIAVIEADKLADAALAQAGFPGAGLGERLMNMGSGRLASLDGLWWAHKVRNRLAHEVDFFLRYTEARQAVGYYEQTLNELRAI